MKFKNWLNSVFIIQVFHDHVRTRTSEGKILSKSAAPWKLQFYLDLELASAIKEMGNYLQKLLLFHAWVVQRTHRTCECRVRFSLCHVNSSATHTFTNLCLFCCCLVGVTFKLWKFISVIPIHNKIFVEFPFYFFENLEDKGNVQSEKKR